MGQVLRGLIFRRLRKASGPRPQLTRLFQLVGWLYVHLHVCIAPAAQAALRSSMHCGRCAALLALLRVAAAPPPDGVTGVTAIVIPVHDSVPLAQGCVAMIAKHTPSDMYRVFVVDDQSSGHASRSMAQFMGFMNASQHRFISMSDRMTEAHAGSTQALDVGVRAALADPAVDSVLLLQSNTAAATRAWLPRLREVLFSGARDDDDAHALAELFHFVDLNADGALDVPPPRPHAAEGDFGAARRRCNPHLLSRRTSGGLRLSTRRSGCLRRDVAERGTRTFVTRWHSRFGGEHTSDVI